MDYTVKVKIDDQDLYKFLIYHNFRGAQGKLGIVIALLAFVAAVITYGRVEMLYTVLYVVCGVVFIIYTPLSLKFRSKRQFQLVPDLKEEMTYTFSDEGIVSAIKDQSVQVKWINLFKIVGIKDYIYIYTDRLHASIIPKRCIEDYEGLVDFMNLKTPKGKVKIK
ncbi:MAG: YcxB family protein [Lachnospiraceae bacterium]|nr:YcxB family protein [Lachnospiraceae bacterium]